LEASQRLGIGYRTNTAAITAITALQSLSSALSDYVDDEPELRPVKAYLTDPPSLMAELRDTVSSYVAARSSADLAKLASFSLILFRHHDFDGEVGPSAGRPLPASPAAPHAPRPRRPPETPPLLTSTSTNTTW
jgi:hypothetical protein